jgi:hypothetical protein
MYVLILIASMLVTPPVWASDFYLNLGVGVSQFQRTTQNGTWFQEGQPYRMNLTDMAGKLGLGYTLNSDWAVEVNALSFGKATSSGLAVPDEYYVPEKHAPKHGAPKPNHFDARQRSFGGELALVRSFTLGEFRPFLRAGGWAAYNDMPYTIIDVPTGQTFQSQYVGYTVGIVGGGGIGWKFLYLDANYYRGLGTLHYPISKSDLMVSVGVQIPL